MTDGKINNKKKVNEYPGDDPGHINDFNRRVLNIHNYYQPILKTVQSHRIL